MITNLIISQNTNQILDQPGGGEAAPKLNAGAVDPDEDPKLKVGAEPELTGLLASGTSGALLPNVKDWLGAVVFDPCPKENVGADVVTVPNVAFLAPDVVVPDWACPKMLGVGALVVDVVPAPKENFGGSLPAGFAPPGCRP